MDPLRNRLVVKPYKFNIEEFISLHESAFRAAEIELKFQNQILTVLEKTDPKTLYAVTSSGKEWKRPSEETDKGFYWHVKHFVYTDNFYVNMVILKEYQEHSMLAEIRNDLSELFDREVYSGNCEATLMFLSKGGGWPMHNHGRGRSARIHLPLYTNEQCPFSFLIDGKRHTLHFVPGEAYLINTRVDHEGLNLGDTTRCHLVFECDF